MKKQIYNILKLAGLLFILSQCQEVKDWAARETDHEAPGKVTGVNVQNINGGAVIHYSVPPDKDLMAVKAVYYYTEGGEQLEAFSSSLTDSIQLTGFPDTLQRTVLLISVDNSRNESSPQEVVINPKTPPVELIRRTIFTQPTFGGILVSWKNPTKADIGVSLYASDSTGIMKLNDTRYSNASDGIYIFRGFDSINTHFRIQIRDRWDNYSSVLDTLLKPLFVIQIPGMVNGIAVWTRMGFTYPGNNTSPSSNPECIWRGDAAKQDNASPNDFNATIDGDVASGYLHLARPGNMLSDYTGNSADAAIHLVPIYLTIDMGRSSKLSRHKIWHRPGTVLGDNNLKEYELWATNNLPKGMSDFSDKMESLAYWTSWPEVEGTDEWKNDWVKIAECVTIPPSGATQLVDVTASDKVWALANGFEFDIFPEHQATPFRYVRIVSQRNWAAGTIIHIGEIQFWGAYAD